MCLYVNDPGDRQTDRQMIDSRQTDKQTDIQTDRQTDNQAGRHIETDKQKYWKTNIQIDIQYVVNVVFVGRSVENAMFNKVVVGRRWFLTSFL